jgi:hypothetical protein
MQQRLSPSCCQQQLLLTLLLPPLLLAVLLRLVVVVGVEAVHCTSARQALRTAGLNSGRMQVLRACCLRYWPCCWQVARSRWFP